MTWYSKLVVAAVLLALGLAGVETMHPGAKEMEGTSPVATNTVQEIRAGGDRYTVMIPQGATLITAVLDNGIAWAVVPTRHQADQQTIVYFTPFRPGGGNLEERRVTLRELPSHELVDGHEGVISLGQLLPAGKWLVLTYFAQVPGFAQPSWLRLEAVHSETRQRELVWQGSTTGGNHFRFGVGPGVVIYVTGHTTETGIQVDEFMYVHLSSGIKRKLPISEWPQSIEFRGGQFVITDIHGRVHKVDASTGAVTRSP